MFYLYTIKHVSVLVIITFHFNSLIHLRSQLAVIRNALKHVDYNINTNQTHEAINIIKCIRIVKCINEVKMIYR